MSSLSTRTTKTVQKSMGLRTPLHRSAHSASPSSPPAACTLIHRPSHVLIAQNCDFSAHRRPAYSASHACNPLITPNLLRPHATISIPTSWQGHRATDEAASPLPDEVASPLPDEAASPLRLEWLLRYPAAVSPEYSVYSTSLSPRRPRLSGVQRSRPTPQRRQATT